ncbi:LamG-like jellyroll fold domain-containing protein [Cerasicoccus maritimus]|uniref:golvesin C-terminal-like domain-containing protein n=1 Tax=Cerasicoccus maritimus TaxID=490089 RepID=UPI002852701B|nr:LamG-like jellyroll fold domain-containing protein [Cerasicoccus maritimus]
MPKIPICSAPLLTAGLLLFSPSLDAIEIIVDNTDSSQTSSTGAWSTSSSTAGYYGSDYAHDNNTNKGQNTFTFTPDIPTTDYYEVFLRWCSYSNRATNVPVTVTHADGTENFLIDQTVAGGQWVPLGVYSFDANDTGNVLIETTGTSGYVIADAVRLLTSVPAPEGLAAQWQLNETTGLVAFDSANLHDGDLYGDVSWTRNGKHLGAAEFDGDNDWIEVMDSDAFDGDAVTISCWFSPRTLDANPRGIVSKRQTYTQQRAFSIFTWHSNQLYIDIGSERFATGYVVTDQHRWHHLSVVFDGALSQGRLKLYVDGELEFEAQPNATAIADTSANLFIGSLNANYGTTFDGFIDDVRFYERALDSVEINNVLDSGMEHTKLHLTASMIIDETAASNMEALVDEQDHCGDPVFDLPNANSPTSNYGNAASWYYPLHAIIDLGAEHEISYIAFFDSNNNGEIEISSGEPFNWTSLITDNLTAYQQWKVYPVDVNTRYIRYTDYNGISPPEILIYGTSLGTVEPEPEPVHYSPPPFDQFLGVNAQGRNPLHRLEAVGFIRQYRSWAYCEGHNNWATYPGYPNNLNGFAPAYTNGNYDNIYTRYDTVGLDLVMTIQDSVKWLDGIGGSIKPNAGRPSDEPASYIEHADHLFQTAARYGSQPVADNLLKLNSNNPRYSGMGLVQYYENWNEQNRWWDGRDEYFTPYEYAAMSSADADGHQGVLGSDKGIWNADPNTRLAMGGIVKMDLDYIKAMRFWALHNRIDGELPWDVINLHHYANDRDGEQYVNAQGISPEEDNLRERLLVFRDYCDRYMPGVELWVSEFGYDTASTSPQHAPAIGTFSAEEVQAQWNVRSFLAMAAGGVDRAMVYSLADDVSSGTGLYNTCGLTSDEWSGYQPKPAWWYVYTLKNRLKGLYFEDVQDSGDEDVRIYRFMDGNGVIKAYAVWCPTVNQTEVNGYSLQLQGSPTTADLVELTVGDPDGVKTPLTINSGAVSIDVSERPVFVMIDHTEPDFELTQKLTLTPSMVTNESGLGDATMMVDEQTLSGDPRDDNGGSPTTSWSPGGGAHSAYIDLGQVRNIDRIYLYDTSNSGPLTIEIGTPGNWSTLTESQMTGYNSWWEYVYNVDTTQTQYLRITRTGGANFNEIVIYGK